LQRVLEAETDGHPGCEKHGSSGDNSGDSRNGYSGKTVATENQEPEGSLRTAAAAEVSAAGGCRICSLPAWTGAGPVFRSGPGGVSRHPRPDVHRPYGPQFDQVRLVPGPEETMRRFEGGVFGSC
jgi:hypothetical protein